MDHLPNFIGPARHGKKDRRSVVELADEVGQIRCLLDVLLVLGVETRKQCNFDPIGIEGTDHRQRCVWELPNHGFARGGDE